jgi:hypothetical protein
VHRNCMRIALVRNGPEEKTDKNVEGRLKSSWTGGSAPLLCGEAVIFMLSCSGGGNAVVARSSAL